MIRRKPGYYTPYTDIIDKIYKQAKKMARLNVENHTFAQVGEIRRQNASK